MRVGQPQAPGYFLYIMLGRLVNSFVGDPHASLVWISVAFGSAAGARVSDRNEDVRALGRRDSRLDGGDESADVVP